MATKKWQDLRGKLFSPARIAKNEAAALAAIAKMDKKKLAHEREWDRQILTSYARAARQAANEDKK